jgi:hypothetical protein
LYQEESRHTLNEFLMQVEVKTVLDVNWRDEDLGTLRENDPVAKRLEDSVAEAVCNALYDAASKGFSHGMETLIAILPDNPIVARIVR